MKFKGAEATNLEVLMDFEKQYNEDKVNVDGINFDLSGRGINNWTPIISLVQFNIHAILTPMEMFCVRKSIGADIILTRNQKPLSNNTDWKVLSNLNDLSELCKKSDVRFHSEELKLLNTLRPSDGIEFDCNVVIRGNQIIRFLSWVNLSPFEFVNKVRELSRKSNLNDAFSHLIESVIDIYITKILESEILRVNLQVDSYAHEKYRGLVEKSIYPKVGNGSMPIMVISADGTSCSITPKSFSSGSYLQELRKFKEKRKIRYANYDCFFSVKSSIFTFIMLYTFLPSEISIIDYDDLRAVSYGKWMQVDELSLLDHQTFANAWNRSHFESSYDELNTAYVNLIHSEMDRFTTEQYANKVVHDDNKYVKWLSSEVNKICMGLPIEYTIAVRNNDFDDPERFLALSRYFPSDIYTTFSGVELNIIIDGISDALESIFMKS